MRWTWLLALALAMTQGAAADSLEPLLRRRAESFVAAMNAPGSEALEAFVRDHLESRLAREGKAASLAARLRSDLAELGRVQQHTVRVLGGGRLVFVFCKMASTGAWFNFQFRVLPEDDHRLQWVFRAVALEPMDPPPAALESPAGLAWLEAFRRRLDEQHPFSGVALVRREGKDVYALVQGPADVSAKVPLTRATRLGMASGSKMFTAVAILQLAQAGKLALDAPLSRYLTGLPSPDFAQRATIHQLLTHTAGAGDYWDDEYESAWDSVTELRQMLPFVLRHLGESPPGEFSYSNSGFILLGLVVEAVSGESFYDYVREHIFEPAGMTATGFPLRSEAGKDLAVPYEPEMEAGATKIGSYLPARLNARGTSAGGAATTADDLLRFAEALLGGRLLDKAHADLLRRPHVPYGEQAYGYGTIVETKDRVLSFGHGGIAPGTHCEFKIYPQLNTVMVVLSNYNTIGGPEMANALDTLIRNSATSTTSRGSRLLTRPRPSPGTSKAHGSLTSHDAQHQRRVAPSAASCCKVDLDGCDYQLPGKLFL
jgi:CubicO group peptidase (beta-lactamase class C family)